MPEIKIIDTGRSFQESGQRSNLSAALMAVTLSNGTLRADVKRPKRTKPEATRPGNPNKLTQKQHVFPWKSMERFTKEGYVSVYLIAHGKEQPLKPKDVLFCARRAWDQRSESGYMKQIEREFQTVATPIIEGKARKILLEQKPAVDRMYALWFARASYRDLDEQDTQLNGIAGQALTKEQEENLEKNGYMFAREGGKWPARQFNGLRIQTFIDQYSPQVTPARWGIITARSGEFIVPDIPSNMILPLSPSLALAGSAADAVIGEENLAEINRALSGGSRKYFFASDLSNAPGWRA